MNDIIMTSYSYFLFSKECVSVGTNKKMDDNSELINRCVCCKRLVEKTPYSINCDS